MNKHTHRLVFDRRRGMRVPAAEHARSAGKAAGGQTRAAVAVGVLSLISMSDCALAQLRTDSGAAAGAVSRLPSQTWGSARVSAGVAAALNRARPNLPTYTADGKWTQNTGDYSDPTYSADGRIMTLVQNGQTIILNWDTFDISKGYELRFEQKAGDRALNRVHDIHPSVIDGGLSGRGEIAIENRNGVVFGPNARVQAGSLVATALSITKEAYEKNFRNFRDRTAAFGSDNENEDGFIGIEAGAEIKALAGGDVIMVAPRIVNKGRIETPQGQAILAAGQKVYLYAQTDLAQRGLMVAVDNFARSGQQPDLGTVVHEGVVQAEKGTINLVGAAIRQKGRLTATTAVKGQNGAIYLQAMENTVDGLAPNNSGEVGSSLNGKVKLANKLGVIELAEGSVTEVLPSSEGFVLNSQNQLVAAEAPTEPAAIRADADPAEKAAYEEAQTRYRAELAAYEANTQKASDTFYRSRIDIIGADITLRAGVQRPDGTRVDAAKVLAPAGEINILAAEDWSSSVLYKDSNALVRDSSLIRMEAGAVVDASGLDNVRLPGSRHQLKGRLFSIELADSPVQRGGVIYRSELLADARRVISVGDVSGLYSNRRYTASELSTVGGAVRLQAQGFMDLMPGAQVDFSGGSVVFEAASVTSSLLAQASNNAYTRIEDADAGIFYSALLSDPSRATASELARFGLSADAVTGANVLETRVGKSAGAALLAAPSMRIDAALDGSVYMNSQQRASDVSSALRGGYSADGKSFALTQGLSEWTDASHAIPWDAELSKAPHRYTTLRPNGGTLAIGNEVRGEANGVPLDQVVDAVRVTSSGGSGMNDAGEFVISASALQNANLGALHVMGNTFSLGDEGGFAANLQLTPGAVVDVRAIGDIDIRGAITAAGGNIGLTAITGSINVAQGSTLSVAGVRRDERFQSAPANEAADVTAGSLKLSAGQGMNLQGLLDVSAGVWRTSGGSFSKGNAGSLELSVNTYRLNAAEALDHTLVWGAGFGLAGHDFDDGGKITLKGLPALRIGDRFSAQPGELDFQVDINALASAGFGTQSFEAIGDVTVGLGAQLKPVLRNLLQDPTRPTSASLARLGTLTAGKRAGVQLSLTARAEPGVQPEGLEQGADMLIEQGARIDVGAGGAIALMAGGNLDVKGELLARGGRVSLSLQGQRGSDSDSSVEAFGYLPEQHIRLHDGALIDVSGVVKSYRADGQEQRLRDDQVRVFGEVLGGGSVTIGSAEGRATRGRFVMDAGANIRMDGASGFLDFGRVVDKRFVAAGAGTLTIGVTDGFELLGGLSAQAGHSSVAGGTVKVVLTQDRLVDRTAVSPYPTGEVAGQRTIHVEATSKSAQARAEDKLRFGEGVLSSDVLLNAGFERISLRADHSIDLQKDAHLMSLSARGPLQSVVLDAPLINLADEGLHFVRANHVGLGQFSPAMLSQAPLSDATKGSAVAAAGGLQGTGTLAVSAGLIEVSGDVGIQGADQTILDATLDRQGGNTRRDGEVRLIGAREVKRNDLQGQLSYAGWLNVRAGQVYATTLSNFSVVGHASASGLNLFSLLSPEGGATSQVPLSALASLSLKADTLYIDGQVRQPFGRVDLSAKELITGDNGRVSVSGLQNDGSNLLVPVGSTINQTQWVYATQGAVAANGLSEALDPAIDPTLVDLSKRQVDKRVTLNGDTLSLSESSLVDGRAGGDLIAWEFKKGVGGSTDTYNRPGVYAILPGQSFDFAPHDADISASSAKLGKALQVGDQVTVTTGSGVLAAGTYTLLDARYGILPGAVLVQATTLNTTQALSQAIANDDGSVVVSGFLGTAGTARQSGSPKLALKLEPEATHRAQSQVIRTSGNAYLDQLSERTGDSYRRAGDAAVVSFAAKNAFDLAAQVRLEGRDGLRAGLIDVAMPNMQVSRTQLSETQLNEQGEQVEVQVPTVRLDTLQATGADSILLGGTRQVNADGGWDVKREASVVRFVGEPAVEGEPLREVNLAVQGELLAVATQRVQVDDGVNVSSVGADDGQRSRHVIDGDGAALFVGNRVDTELSVTGVSAEAKGDLVVGRSHLEGQAVQLDATGALKVDLGAQVRAQSLGLGAPRVAVGANADDTLAEGTLNLSGDLLDQVNQGRRLQLRAYQGMDFYRDVMLGSATMDRLSLDTPLLRGVGTAEQVATVKAREVVLGNLTGRGGDTSESSKGGSQIRIEALPVLQDGRTGGVTVAASAAKSAAAISGQHLAFANAVIASRGDVAFEGRGRLSAQADLKIEAARVTAKADAEQTVSSDRGTLVIDRATDATTLGESLGAGGALTLSGQRVEQRGVIDIESGRLALQGAGQAGRDDTIVFAQGSTTSVAGRARQVSENLAVASHGGRIDAKAAIGQIQVNGVLDASAPVMPAGQEALATDAGRITFQATGDRGAVVMGDAAKLRLEAVSGGQGGTLQVDARRLLSAAQAAAEAGGAQQVASQVDLLVNAAQATAQAGAIAPAHHRVAVRVRDGDVVLNTQLRASTVQLTADGGELTLGSSARVLSDAEAGGLVQLQARDDLTLSHGAQVSARSSREGANGGDVLLSSTDGRVKLGDATVVADSATDARSGRIVVRAGQDGADIRVDRLADDGQADTQLTLQAGQVDLVGVKVYEAAQRTSLVAGNTSATAWGLSSLHAEADAYTAEPQRTAMLDRLGLSANQVNVKAEAEIRAAGDFVLNGDLNFERGSNKVPMNLTVRAGADLVVKGNVSAGFGAVGKVAANATKPSSVSEGDASSFRFVAGADQQSADLLAVQADPSKGHFELAGDKHIRTTAGSIEVAASGDVRLLSTSASTPLSSAIYVAGRLASLNDGESAGGLPYTWAQHTERGGRLSVSAGGDVRSLSASKATAQALTQLTPNYFFHAGATKAQVAWWTAFDSFRQGLGSFGGGNISVQAGQDVRDMPVVSLTNARQVKFVDDTLVLREIGGGDVEVTAGRDIAGGQFVVARGDGTLSAGRSVTRGAGVTAASDGSYTNTQVLPSAPFLGVMDGHWSVKANENVEVSHVFNPTLLHNATNPASGTQSRLTAQQAGHYLTYGPDAGVSMFSTRGDVAFAPNNQSLRLLTRALSNAGGSLSVPSGDLNDLQTLSTVLPAVFRMISLNGNAEVNGGGVEYLRRTGSKVEAARTTSSRLYVTPSAQADFRVYAGQDLGLRGTLQVLDAEQVASLMGATADAPVGTSGLKAIVSTLGSSADRVEDSFGSLVSGIQTGLQASPINQSEDAGHGGASTWVAGRDIRFERTGTDSAGLRTNRPTELIAGRDILSPSFLGQNFDETDVTRVSAGRDILGGATNTGAIVLGGPGQLRVQAGRDVQLEQSSGIAAIGNSVNQALPDQGAKITVAAGMARSVDLPATMSRYGSDAAWRGEVRLAVIASRLPPPAGRTSWSEASDAEVEATFATLTQPNQVAALQSYLDARFVAEFLPELAGRDEAFYRSDAFQRLKHEAMWQRAQALASEAAAIKGSDNDAEEARRKARRQALYEQAARVVELAGLGQAFERDGLVNLANGRVHNRAPGGGETFSLIDNSLGGIDVIAADDVLFGLPASDGVARGLINFSGGSMRILAGGDVLAGEQRAIVAGRGNLFIYSTDGDVDTGQASNTEVSQIAPRRAFNELMGRVVTITNPPLTGGGVQSILPPADINPKLGLYAPNGEIRALDAFVVGIGPDIGSPVVKGADNIAGQSSSGAAAPATSVNLTPKLANTQAGVEQASQAGNERKQASDEGKLSVELLGLGAEGEAAAAGAAKAEAQRDPPSSEREDKERQNGENGSSGTGKPGTQAPTPPAAAR